MSIESYDAIVVGGGPGGAIAASLIAMDGNRVLLLEKEVFPRYQIGESLLPSTIHGICDMVGARDAIDKAGFIPKRGGTFRWGANPEPWTFAFAVSSKMAGPTSYAYQVERSKFDTILLDNAKRLGVDVRQGHRVVEALRTDERVNGVRYVDDAGGEHEASAAFVVDASGNKSRLHESIGGRRLYSPHFQNVAIFGYFEGGKRLPEPNQGNILCAAFPDGWFWYIPLTCSDELTSVGAVIRKDLVPKTKADREGAFHALIDECPMIKEYLANARRTKRAPYDQLRVRLDYSYDRTSLWCPGMVLVGDAGCFIDPVFSSGVHLATYSGLLAARSINSVLAGDVTEERCFREFEQRYRHEFGLFHDFLLAFYEMHQDEESYFSHARKTTGSQGDAQEAFLDLVGGVSSSDFVGSAKTSRDRVHAVKEVLNKAKANTNASGEAEGMFRAPVLREIMEESSNLQISALLGEDAGKLPPMFPGGLTSSANGRRWSAPGQSTTPDFRQ